MKGSWKNQREINREDWDKLVNKSYNASVYLQSYYLDATAKDWDAYVAADFSYAIPIGITKKFGVISAYTPLFIGYLSPFGNIKNLDWDNFKDGLIKRYQKGNLFLKGTLIKGHQFNSDKKVYQTLKKEDFKLKSLAKRQLNLFKKSGYTIKTETIKTSELTTFIINELAKKLAVFSSKDRFNLIKIIDQAEKRGQLYKIAAYKENQLVGGLIGIQFKEEFLYLKGAAFQEAMQSGVMYQLMHQFIHYGFENNCSINFGGSRVKSIRFFFQRFNGIDVNYNHYTWDNSPFLFQLLMRGVSSISKWW